jgi:hypothetical protein
MLTVPARACAQCVVWTVLSGIVVAQGNNVNQVDWETRTASCPAKVTQSTNSTVRVTNVNDLLIDFKTGETAQYQLRAKGTPFFSQIATPGACDPTQLVAHIDAVRRINNSSITPVSGERYIPLAETINAAHNESAVGQVEADMARSDQQCREFFSAHAADSVVQWVHRLDAQPGGNSSGAPPHSIDFGVNLEPNQNYEFTIQASWKGKKFRNGTLTWNCGETDILSLSVGPLITTLPYRTYTQQQVPVSGGGTQNELVVSGNTNVNVLGAALLNYHLPTIPLIPQWTGLAFSVGPVYTLGDAPSVSKLGLFVGASMHLYRSLFLTPGIHIGQFADFPAGFQAGAVIPPNFGNLTPVTRNTAHFAIGITFKATTFKRSSQNNGAASNAGSTSSVANKSNQPGQRVSGSPGTEGHSASPNTPTGAPSAPSQPQKPQTVPDTPPNAASPPQRK